MFDAYTAEMDSDTINNDFDEVDLFGEIMIEDDTAYDYIDFG